MKVAIVGYGRMGQMVHSLIEGSGVHEAVSIVDPSSSSGRVTSLSLTDAVLSRADVAIDFSVPSAVRSNAAVYARTGTPAVIGTTGWGSDLSAIDASRVRIIHSGNFSIGVALFLSLVSEAARLFDPFDQYDLSVSEIHHRMKADAPSGTALMIADRLLKGLGRKDHLVIGNPDGVIAENGLEVSSMRVGSEPGTHTVTIDGESDTITLTHRARSREGFARGAIRAAEWLLRQDNGIYTMDDFISDMLGGRE